MRSQRPVTGLVSFLKDASGCPRDVSIAIHTFLVLIYMRGCKIRGWGIAGFSCKMLMAWG